MHDDNDVDELTAGEREAFRRLPREIAPSAALEDRVASALRDSGTLRRRRPWHPHVWQVAAAMLLIAGGFFAGRLRAPAVAPPAETRGQQYLLLLYGAPSATPDIERARVAEYGNWARAEAAAGRLIMGERLGDNRAVLGSDTAAPPASHEPSGFFLIRAATFEEASRTAARCPHVAHGGTVVVRRIE
ncbi:MAG TPA: YciI family protein [Vicinamibacterales bacterium]|nr:YciI family protein [Vicinamibacterales bacterium]